MTTTSAHHQPTRAGAAAPPAGHHRRGRVRTVAAWHAHAVTALPLALFAMIAAVTGHAGQLDRAQRRLARTLLGVPATGTARPRRAVQVLAHSLAGLPTNLLAFALVVPAWSLFVARGVLYPIFGADHLEHSWGGPTLPGAWIVHFIQGPPLLLAVTLALWPIIRLHTRLTR